MSSSAAISGNITSMVRTITIVIYNNDSGRYVIYYDIYAEQTLRIVIVNCASERELYIFIYSLVLRGIRFKILILAALRHIFAPNS